MNVHIRCKGNIAPNCGVNSVELAKGLAEMGLQAGGISKRNSVVSERSVFVCQNQTHVDFVDFFFLCNCYIMSLSVRFFLKLAQVNHVSQKRPMSERQESREIQQALPRLGMADFTFVQVLGKGSFGKVTLHRICISISPRVARSWKNRKKKNAP